MSADNYTIESRVRLNDGETYPRFGLGKFPRRRLQRRLRHRAGRRDLQCGDLGSRGWLQGERGLYNEARAPACLQTRSLAVSSSFLAPPLHLVTPPKHIDGAEWYENEESCGKAIRDFMERTGTPRSEIFFTTKLMHNKTDPAWVEHCVDVSTQKAGISPDLYLIHDPNGGPEVRAAMWEGCCRVKDKGKVKSIGVSNFGVKHLEDLLAGKPKYVPAVNQIDLHPFMTRNELVAYCESKGIVLEAWAPLVRGLRFKHPVVVEIAEKYKKSPAQVLIRYGLDRGFIVIPKSTHKERIIDNANVFDFKLEKADLDRLTSLDEFLVTDWEVSTVP